MTLTVTPDETLAAPDLRISMAHTGDFMVGQNGTYVITVANVGAGSTTGMITVTDTLPTELTFVVADGTGWECNVSDQHLVCTMNDPLQPGARTTFAVTAYPRVAGMVTNSAAVAVLGDGDPSNNVANDPTTIFDIPTWTATPLPTSTLTPRATDTFTPLPSETTTPIPIDTGTTVLSSPSPTANFPPIPSNSPTPG
jgi:uncharacterized repeat protein (TIGR01451 family)